MDLRLNPRSSDGDTKFLFVQVAKPVTWKEPQFTDNVKIEHVMTRFESIANQAIGLDAVQNDLMFPVLSAIPGSDMALGRHLVIYQATDKAKNMEKCVFTITVVQFKQDHPGRQ